MIYVENPLSVEKNSMDDNFTIYPNPSNGLINIAFNIDGEVGEVFIYDNLGRVINNKIIINENSIRVEGLQNGIFYIKIIVDKEAVIKKIIVN